MPWIDCKKVANEIMEEAKTRLEKYPHTTLAILSVGNDPASEVYVRNKVRACAEVGINCTVCHIPSNIDQEYLNRTIHYSSRDADGLILQLPIPDHLNVDKAVSCIRPEADVDGLSKDAIVTPCTPLGIMRIINSMFVDSIAGLDAVIIGRSNLVGKPLAKLLTDNDCTVTLCHSKTKDLKKYTSTADIVIVAVGIPGFLTPDMVRDGSVVIDVGINRVDGKLVGDVAPGVEEKAYVTPVPGGVGKTTVASLMLNLAELRSQS